MNVEQQMFTSGKPEFVTIAMSGGLSREERLALEQHSLYVLPTALMYQENVVTPVKYVYYPLNATRGVVGKAVYAGKDSLGRPGNYFFHNLVFEYDDLQREFDLNPAALICAIEQQNGFQTAAPPAPLTPLEIAPPSRLPEVTAPAVNQADLECVLYAALHHHAFQLPIMLHGTDRECLDFLERLFPLLPEQQRRELSFDTCAYGTGLPFRIQGVPKQPEFRQNLSPTLTLSCATMQIKTSVQRSEAVKWAAAYLVKQRDLKLFDLFQTSFTADDLAVLSAAPDLMRRYAEQADERRAAIFVEWMRKFQQVEAATRYAVNTSELLLFALKALTPNDLDQQKRAALKRLFDALPTAAKSPQMLAEIERVMQPPASFFQRISKKLKGS